MRRSNASSTPLADVNTSQPLLSCSSPGESPKSRGMSRVEAALSTIAPKGSSRSRRRRWKLSVPVSATRTPARGPPGAALSLSAAVGPTTMTAGASAPASRALRAMSVSVPRTHSCFFALPPETTAAGVPASIPASTSAAASASSLPRPMRKTRVPWSFASSGRSSGSPPPEVWAVTTWKLRESSLCVTGMPASSGMATAELMPGTSSHSMPASLRARNSSPPRPKTKGSPPLRRTVSSCLPAQSMSRLFISS